MSYVKPITSASGNMADSIPITDNLVVASSQEKPLEKANAQMNVQK